MYAKLNTKKNQDNKWVAIGFNDNKQMVRKKHVIIAYIIYKIINFLKSDADVVMCIDGQTPTIETWYNYGYNPSTLDSNTKSIGLTQIKVNYLNGALFCSLSREISLPNLEKFRDLNNLYYLLVAKVPINGKFFYQITVYTRE